MDFAPFFEKWSASAGAERANKDAFLIELCRWLGVPEPHATTGDSDRDTYVFERDAILIRRRARAHHRADGSLQQILRLAALSDWSEVDPAIFGTLLERALDARERHQLGAHFTPRAHSVMRRACSGS